MTDTEKAKQIIAFLRGLRAVRQFRPDPVPQEVIDALLPRIDALVQNLGPGSAARLGLDFATLSPRYPRLMPIKRARAV